MNFDLKDNETNNAKMDNNQKDLTNSDPDKILDELLKKFDAENFKKVFIDMPGHKNWTQENKLNFILYLKKYEVDSLYNIRSKHITKYKCGGFTKKSTTNAAIIELLDQINIPYDASKFPKTKQNFPKGYWEDENIVKKCMLDLKGKVANNQTDEDFVEHVLTKDLLNANGLSGLYHNYLDMAKIIIIAFPDINTDLADIKKFNLRPRGYWKDVDNIKKEIKELKSKIAPDISNEEFVVEHFSQNILIENNLRKVLEHYSLKELSKLAFDLSDEFLGNIDKWNIVPNGYWNDKDNCRIWANNIYEKYSMTHYTDWYMITCEEIRSKSPIHKYNNSLADLLIDVFPEIPFVKSQFYKMNKSELEWLNFMKDTHNITDLVYGSTRKEQHCVLAPNGVTRYWLDGFSPSKNTCYEYFGSRYHGNPAVYDKKWDEPIFKSEGGSKTYRQAYENTMKRLDNIKSLGYNVIFIWDTEWASQKRKIKKAQKI